MSPSLRKRPKCCVAAKRRYVPKMRPDMQTLPGSMSICWRKYKSASIRTRRPCASVARRPNIPCHAEDEDGDDALPDEASAQGRHRDGAARTRLQSHPRHEHHGHSAADGRHPGIVKSRTRLASPARAVLTSSGKTFLHDQDPKRQRLNRRNGGLAYLKCSLWSMCCASLTAINRGWCPH